MARSTNNNANANVNNVQDNNANAENFNSENNLTENQENKIMTETQKTTNKKTYIVTAKVKDFNGIVAGVHFAYGKAEVKEGWILEWFKEKGYGVEEKK